MGQSNVHLSEAAIEEYEKLTYLSRKEILYLHRRFYRMFKDKGNYDPRVRVPAKYMITIPELKENPFKMRICEIFSSADDVSLSFEDFLDMMSVFSENTPKAIKMKYAFRIYDLDDDGIISERDLRKAVRLLVAPSTLEEEEMRRLLDNILSESDLDDSRTISFAEFEHIMSKAPEFMSSFRIRL